MISLKIGSILIGGLLLAPLAWIFGSMVMRTEKTDAAAEHSFEEAKLNMEKEFARFDGPGVIMVIKVESMFAPVSFLAKSLGFYPRRWVGVCGLIMIALLFGLWSFSVLVPAKSFQSSIHRDFEPDPEVPIDVGNIIFRNEGTDQSKEKQD